MTAVLYSIHSISHIRIIFNNVLCDIYISDQRFSTYAYPKNTRVGIMIRLPILN